MAKRKKKKKQYTHIREEFYDRLALMCDRSVFDDISATFIERPTTFRVNTIKSNKAEIMKALQHEGFKTREVRWYNDAFILTNKSKRELTDLDIYKEGKIYIQSLASMVPPIVMQPKAGEIVLDLTAAPGSKTSQIAMMMDKQGELVANDKNKIRFFKLKANMELLGVSSTSSRVTSTDDRKLGHRGISMDSLKISSRPVRPLADEVGRDDVYLSKWQFTLRMEPGTKLALEYENYFDKILLDAPCSAEARFVADKPKTFAYWKPQKIKEMAYTQRKLLFAAWAALKPGGTLVYSTCTFAPEENEVQLSRLLERHSDAVLIPIELPGLKKLPVVQEWKGKSIHPDVITHSVRIQPDKEIEGFFIAKLRKKDV